MLAALPSFVFHPVNCFTCIFQDGSILCDPTLKQLSQSTASLLFVFSNRVSGGVPGLVTCHTEGVVDHTKLQECITAASLATQSIFQFYKKTIAKKFSKEVNF